MAEPQAMFDSVREADRAYNLQSTGPDDGGPGGGGDVDPGEGWGQLQDADWLDDRWRLAFQTVIEGSRQRWFVIGLDPSNGSLSAINSAGNTTRITEGMTFSDTPNYSTESDARDAHAKWVRQHGEPGQSEQWGEFEQVDMADPWYIFRREHLSQDREEYFAAGLDPDGAEVYLAADGSLTYEPAIFDSEADLQAALDAYFAAVENGEIDQGRAPTGEPPDPERVKQDGERAAGGGGLLSSPIGLVAIGGVGYLAYKRYGDGDGPDLDLDGGVIE